MAQSFPYVALEPKPLTMDGLIEKKALTKDIADMLHMCVSARLNIMISGGTGAGKTTLSECACRHQSRTTNAS